MPHAVPVIHPAYTFRQPQQLGPLYAHIKGFLKRGLDGLPDAPQVYKNPKLAKFQWLIRQCKKYRRALSVDVESSPPKIGNAAWAKLPKYARLRVVGVGAKLGSGVGLSWNWPMPSDIWLYFLKVMRDPEIPKVFTNGDAYDIPILDRYGCHEINNVDDIRDRRRAMVSTSRTALAAQAAMYLQWPPWKAIATEDDDDEKGYVDPSRIKRTKVLRYNALDNVAQAEIDYLQRKEMVEDEDDAPRLARLYAQQRRLARVGAEMSIRGFPVDEKRMKALSIELTKRSIQRAKEFVKLTEKYGKIQVNTKGGVNQRDFAALIFRESAKTGIKGFNLMVPFSDKCRTDSGEPSVDQESLLYLFSQDNTPPELKEIMRAYWKVNAPLKARNTYIDSEDVKSRIGPDGRIHASINTCGAETGRWSCSKPNLFNLSEEQKEDAGSLRGDIPNIRDMYVAPPGYVIVHRDWKQLELWIVADYTQDMALLDALQSGDPHTIRARMWFGIAENEEVPKIIRRISKEVGFSCNYHAGVETVYMRVLKAIQDADFATVAMLHKAFPDNHPGIAAHWERSLAFAIENGYNETPIMQRRRYYPPATILKDTETSNYAIQGGAADIANATMVGIEEADYKRSLHYRLTKHFPDAWIAMHTYDSFDIICKKKDAVAVDQLLTECMDGPWKIGPKPRKYLSDGNMDKKILATRWSQV